MDGESANPIPPETSQQPAFIRNPRRSLGVFTPGVPIYYPEAEEAVVYCLQGVPMVLGPKGRGTPWEGQCGLISPLGMGPFKFGGQGPPGPWVPVAPKGILPTTDPKAPQRLRSRSPRQHYPMRALSAQPVSTTALPLPRFSRPSSPFHNNVRLPPASVTLWTALDTHQGRTPLQANTPEQLRRNFDTMTQRPGRHTPEPDLDIMMGNVLHCCQRLADAGAHAPLGSRTPEQLRIILNFLVEVVREIRANRGLPGYPGSQATALSVQLHAIPHLLQLQATEDTERERLRALAADRRHV